MKNEDNQEKKEIKGILYEEQKITQVLNLLNTLSVTGMNQVKALNMVFEILTNPVPFNNQEAEK